jgi:hypothetical protein
VKDAIHFLLTQVLALLSPSSWHGDYSMQISASVNKQPIISKLTSVLAKCAFMEREGEVTLL